MELSPGGIIAWIIVGLIAGWAASSVSRGHGYGIIGDIIVRHQRQRGAETFFLTGVDEHADKVARVAAEQGLTPRELEATVQKQLASLVRDPHVTVIVHDVNGQRVFVTGMVGHPGAFPLRNSMGVLQALALAGGLAEFADRGSISVLRADGRRLEVAYDDLVTGKSKVTLGPGDTVVVP